MSGTYPVSLFNDIHRYFPEILYEPERFTNVTELLLYIRSQVRINSDPYLQGLQTYNTRQHQFRHSTPSPQRRNHYPPSSSIPEQSRRSTTTTFPVSMIFEGNNRHGLNPLESITGSMLRELLVSGSSLLGTVNERVNPSHQNVMEPVYIRPTAQQLAAASTISIVCAEEVTEEATCAICQDQMVEGSQVRKLNRCRHAFHIECVDTWFQTHISCPVCRNDIRE